MSDVPIVSAAAGLRAGDRVLVGRLVASERREVPHRLDPPGGLGLEELPGATGG